MLLLFLQIHPNCRIRRVYFTDRLYSNEELPNDYTVKVSEEGKLTPSITIVMADKSLLVPAGLDQVYEGTGIGTGLPPTAAGQDHVTGLESILNSAETEPFKLWKKEVGVSLWSELVLMHQTFLTINIGIFYSTFPLFLLNYKLV